MNKFRNIVLFLCLTTLSVMGQDEVLMTIAGKPVMRSEFERIYHKNNQVSGADQKSVADYLDLFIDFKLKVLEAHNEGYDTVKSFIDELNGYREQLAKPYLEDQKVADSLLKEAYYRTTHELNASHIMVRLPDNPSPADTLKGYQRIMQLRKQILEGESFDSVARSSSDDPSAKQNGGLLGWFSAFMMVYPFENAAYHTPVGSVSMPVRSRYGYHLVKVNAMRASLGEIKLAHIMVRVGETDSPEKKEEARKKIEQYYALLNGGEPFADVARKYSEDAGSARNGGQMRWIKSGELPPDIEDKVFALKDSGSYTEPLQSSYGWHIFELIGNKPVPSFDVLKTQLSERIAADERGKLAVQALVNRIKKESDYREYPGNVEALAELMDSSVYVGKWDPRVAGSLIEPVFSVNGKDFTQRELADYVIQTKKYRKDLSVLQIVRSRFNSFVSQELIAYEKSRLEEKYPEFKNLMQEYHDGILLFNISDKMVWSKAVKDTIGLQNYFEQHQDAYQWKERADVSVYTFTNSGMIKLYTQLARKRMKQNWSQADFLRQACPGDTVPCLLIHDGKYEKGDTALTGNFVWKKDRITQNRTDNALRLVAVNRLLPPMPKTFQEVRGEVTADYQHYLDQQWIASLRKKYPVIVNTEVLKHIHP